MNDMLFEGTSNRSSSQIANEIEFLGSHLTNDVSREHTFIAVSGMSDTTGNGLEIIADTILNPIFPTEEIERIRKEKLADLQSIQDSADATAAIATRSILLGSASPYGHTITGNETSVTAINRDDIQNQYQDMLHNSNKTFLVVGDISPDNSIELLNEKFEELPNQQKNRVDDLVSQNTDQNSPVIYLVDRPSSAQSILRAGHTSIPREHPDYHSLAFVNYILGGDYSSRLNMNLRQDKGYSYGFHSSIEWMTPFSIFLARGSVQTEVTKESVFETLKELGEIREANQIGLDEFRKAKEGLIKSVPSQFESNQQIISQMLNMAGFNLPTNHFESNIKKISELTIDEVRESALKHLSPNDTKVIVVGDRDKVQKGLEELGYPIKHIDMYGNPV